ncbi:MAG: hypothetical protein ACRDP6_17800, partial [Actinoallomurus sp.]
VCDSVLEGVGETSARPGHDRYAGEECTQLVDIISGGQQACAFVHGARVCQRIDDEGVAEAGGAS